MEKSAYSLPFAFLDTLAELASNKIQEDNNFVRAKITPLENTRDAVQFSEINRKEVVAPLNNDSDEFPQRQRSRAFSESWMLSTMRKSMLSRINNDLDSDVEDHDGDTNSSVGIADVTSVGGTSEASVTTTPSAKSVLVASRVSMLKAKPGIYSYDQRVAAIQRYHLKRERRVWKKKIRYYCRKNLADRRLRVKGRFIKAEDADHFAAEVLDGVVDGLMGMAEGKGMPKTESATEPTSADPSIKQRRGRSNSQVSESDKSEKSTNIYSLNYRYTNSRSRSRGDSKDFSVPPLPHSALSSGASLISDSAPMSYLDRYRQSAVSKQAHGFGVFDDFPGSPASEKKIHNNEEMQALLHSIPMAVDAATNNITEGIPSNSNIGENTAKRKVSDAEDSLLIELLLSSKRSRRYSVA